MTKSMDADAVAGRALSRRGTLAGGLVLGGFLLVGCSPSGGRSADGGNVSADPAASTRKAAMTVYRDPSCGCCEAWATIAEQAGYQVSLLDDADMTAVKQRLGVPPQLASCHTTLVDGLVVEGHVPLDQVDRLLRERPAGIAGIAVPGMPLGSPGMEVPDGSVQPYQVIAFKRSGETSVYRA